MPPQKYKVHSIYNTCSHGLPQFDLHKRFQRAVCRGTISIVTSWHNQHIPKTTKHKHPKQHIQDSWQSFLGFSSKWITHMPNNNKQKVILSWLRQRPRDVVAPAPSHSRSSLRGPSTVQLDGYMKYQSLLPCFLEALKYLKHLKTNQTIAIWTPENLLLLFWLRCLDGRLGSTGATNPWFWPFLNCRRGGRFWLSSSTGWTGWLKHCKLCQW